MTESVDQRLRAQVGASLSRNVTADIVARGGYLATRLLIPPFVLNHIGLEAYGLWASIFVIVAYIGLSSSGISNVYVKYVAQYRTVNDTRRANALLSTGFAVSVGISAAILVGLHYVWPLVADWLEIPPSLEAYPIVVGVVATFLCSISFSVFSDALIGAQNLAAVRIIWMVAYLIETLLIFVLVGRGYGLHGLVGAYIVRTAIEITLGVAVAARTLPWLRLSVRLISRDAIHTLMSFGGVVQLLNCIAIFLNSISRILAASLIGLHAAGIVELASKLPSMAGLVPGAFPASLMPAASCLESGLSSEGRIKRAATDLYLNSARYMNFAAGAICGVLALWATPVLSVWLGQDLPHVSVLMIAAALAVQVHMMTGPGTSILRGMGCPGAEFRYALPNLGILIAFLAASRILVGSWTMIGIAVPASAATILAAVHFIDHTNTRFGVGTREYVRGVVLPGLMPYAAAGVLAIPAAVVVNDLTRIGGAMALAVLGSGYLILLGFAVYWFVLKPTEIDQVRSLARSIKTSMAEPWSKPGRNGFGQQIDPVEGRALRSSGS